MEALYFMYDMVSAVRADGMATEIIHRKTVMTPRKKISEKMLFGKKDAHSATQSYEDVRTIFKRDCSVLSPRQYAEDRFIPSNRPVFIEFQSMDSVHEGEHVMINAADIMSYGGTTNDGGVHVILSSGLLFLMPISLKVFAHAHEKHRRLGRFATAKKKQVA